jgi:transposase
LAASSFRMSPIGLGEAAPGAECQRNIEMIWLTGQLAPDFKTIADFRKDNGKAIREICREFVAPCRKLDLFSEASVADGSKFKAGNARDKNFTEASAQ